jgi:lysophospholipase L1-like esterase
MPISLLLMTISSILTSFSSLDTTKTNQKPLSYLALGDSYTIGEGVPEKERYPLQLVETLNKSGKYAFSIPQIIAKTGWTVDELDAGINATKTQAQGYDLVTLLIGVNNQYRGRAVKDFENDFEAMLKRAIDFAGGKNDRVIVISIPDWGVTPFAVNRNFDQQKVAREIDAYNVAKKTICANYSVVFIDITEDYRKIGNLPAMVVEDQLHPSGAVYNRWASALQQAIGKMTF